MMQKIIYTVTRLLGNGVLMTMNRICGTLNNVFGYLDRKLTSENEAKRDKKIESAAGEIEKACDSGDIGDLFNAVEKMRKAKKTAVCAMLCFAACGCETIQVNTVRGWEGRYDTVQDAENALSGARLGKKESIWILSSETMKRLLTIKEN